MRVSLLLRGQILLCLLFILTACQTVPRTSTGQSEEVWLSDVAVFEGALTDLHALASWRYSAKVGVTGPAAREQANMVWQFDNQLNKVRFFGPLGIGAVKLEFDQSSVSLSDNQGVLHRGESAEQLLTEITGWPIPIDALNFWLFAVPTPNIAFRYQFDQAGQVMAIEQLGWVIRYADYRNYPNFDSVLTLPRKIVATKTLETGQQVVVKLITKSWR